MPKAFIEVTLKEGLFDAQGATIQKALRHFGHDAVKNVSIGKLITVEMNNGQPAEKLQQQLDEMCRQLLANPVMEDYEVRLEGSEDATAKTAPEAKQQATAKEAESDEDPLLCPYSTYRALSEEEQLDLRTQALLQHRSWIYDEIDSLNADWILVVGGDVVESGETLETYPSEDRLKELGSANNLVPWVFTRPSL